jgi:hypothetical protein
MRRARKTALGLFAICLAFAPAAGAANVPLGGGQTKLTLDKGFLSYLAGSGLKIEAKQGARRQGAVISLPVSGGSMDLAAGKGEIDQEGAVLIKGSRGAVPLRGITVKTKRTPLLAKVGGSQLKVASARRISSKRVGFASSFKATALTLTAKAATRLNKKLRPKVPFARGQLLGTLTAKPQPRLVTIKEASGGATLVFDPTFLAKLEALFVSVNPIHPAEHSGPSFSFPITPGGALSPQGAEGTLRTGGAIEMLQLGAGQLFWAEPWLDLAAHTLSAEADLEPTPAFPGKVGRTALLDAAPGPFVADPKSRGLSASGIALSLSPPGAEELNQAFAQGKAAFGAGEGVGSMSFTAQGQ